MAIHCFGSINIDHVHQVPRLPRPGETLADTGYARHLGGKGLNQAVAAARSGAAVRFAGAVGADGDWCVEALGADGIDCSGIEVLERPTGHAVIFVDPAGENAIVIHGGANRAMEIALVERTIAAAEPGDWWLVQNETALVAESARHARAAGLRVAYAAAPFEAALTAEMLPEIDLLVLNEGEAAALSEETGDAPEAWPVPAVLVTMGARGARLIAAPGWPAGPAGSRAALDMPAFPADPVDTTGAGDCFLGAFLAALDRGDGAETALRWASAAAAISVTRAGASTALPHRREIESRLAEARP